MLFMPVGLLSIKKIKKNWYNPLFSVKYADLFCDDN